MAKLDTRLDAKLNAELQKQFIGARCSQVEAFTGIRVIRLTQLVRDSRRMEASGAQDREYRLVPTPD